jgi:hypothetical protein
MGRLVRELLSLWDRTFGRDHTHIYVIAEAYCKVYVDALFQDDTDHDCQSLYITCGSEYAWSMNTMCRVF